jgi:hypothetical protein
VYVSGDTVGDLKGHCDGGNREGYSCTVCRLEKRDDDDYDLIPVYGDCFCEDDEKDDE